MGKAENQGVELQEPETAPAEPERLTREWVRGAGRGHLDPETVHEMLAPTAWTCSRKHTTAGVAHLFERPLSFAEATRLDLEDLRNHRRAASLSRNPAGTYLVRYLVMRDIHESDLSVLPEIERQAAGTGRFERSGFRPSELEVIDRIWRPGEEIADRLGVSVRTVDHYVYLSNRRTGARTREELMVMGLRDGFCEPDSAEVPDGWSDELSPGQKEVIPLLHLPTKEIAGRLSSSKPAIQERILRSLYKTGSSTRGELILRAIANGEYDVRSVDLADGPAPELTPQQEAIASMLERTNKEIMAKLGISRDGLHGHLWELRQRLGAANRKELMLRAVEYGYVETEPDPELADRLTPREQDVLSLVLLTRQETADRLGISERSVSRYIELIMEKTGIHRSELLVVHGVRSGLIEAKRRPRPRAECA